MNKSIIKTAWVYFRAGHSQYLVYTMSMTSFILIVYRLLIEQIPLFETLFPSLSIFIIIFIPIYIPLSIIIGRKHYHSQIETDFIIATKHNPPLQKIMKDIELIKTKLGINEE